VIQAFVTTEFGQHINGLVAGLTNVTREDILLDGKPATKITGETVSVEGPGLPGGISVVYVSSYSGGKVYQLGLFEVYPDSSTGQAEGQLMVGDFNRMVESFRFLE
jgi:hypothetical protein